MVNESTPNINTNTLLIALKSWCVCLPYTVSNFFPNVSTRSIPKMEFPTLISWTSPFAAFDLWYRTQLFPLFKDWFQLHTELSALPYLPYISIGGCGVVDKPLTLRSRGYGFYPQLHQPVGWFVAPSPNVLISFGGMLTQTHLNKLLYMYAKKLNVARLGL